MHIQTGNPISHLQAAAIYVNVSHSATIINDPPALTLTTGPLRMKYSSALFKPRHIMRKKIPSISRCSKKHSWNM